jgi:hypothetical protein
MDKVDRLIEIVRFLKEDGIVSGPPTNNISTGNIAKYNPVMSFTKRKPPTIIGKGRYPGARTRWKPK